METRVFRSGDIAQAAQILRNGGLVAVPTETVYGLCGDGLNAKAVQQIYETKGRPEVKPLSLMVHSPSVIERYCVDVPQAAYHLAKRFLPGPLTIILKSRENVPEIVRAGGATVGIRCPNHPLTIALLRELDSPLAGPSANPSGAESPKTAEMVLRYFDGKIDGVLDGGACGIGVESTLFDMSQTPYRILREGALGGDEILAALRENLVVLGITGGSGGGKTTALNAVQARGGLVLDCDAIYHELLKTDEELLGALRNRFPSAFESGALEIKKIGAIVFAEPESLKELNAITHRFVMAEVERRLNSFAINGGRLAAIDAIALIESGLAKSCKAVIGISAPKEQRIARLMRREGISREYALLRINAQKSDSFFAENCDYILENNGTISDFDEKCRNMINLLMEEK